jgi:hypothetical protein
MMVMILEDQVLLFSLLHDGSIENITATQNGVKFSVDIMYLAEKIEPGFKNILIELIELEEFYFEEADKHFTTFDLQELNHLDLEILKTEQHQNRIKIFCSAGHGTLFGFVNIKTSSIEISDPHCNKINLSKLQSVCKEYWDNFGK